MKKKMETNDGLHVESPDKTFGHSAHQQQQIDVDKMTVGHLMDLVVVVVENIVDKNVKTKIKRLDVDQKRKGQQQPMWR
jgi:hypothetical protein